MIMLNFPSHLLSLALFVPMPFEIELLGASRQVSNVNVDNREEALLHHLNVKFQNDVI